MIRIGSDEQFAAVRNFLKAAYPEDSNVLADRVGDFDPAKHGDEPPLVRLFFLGRAISISDWESVAPESIRTVFSDMGLTEPASNGRIRCSVLLYRSHDKYVVSDRFMSDDGVVGRPAEDCVYYALTDTAHHYLYSLPTSRRYAQVLDIGSGSGVAALILSPNAKQVYATDIAPRCVLFTEFNRRLNGIENIIVREGSLYEPVQGLKFDLITCHPPFDISLSSKKYIYADGGEDGEFVTRGVIAGLPRMLNSGGQFIGAVRATDRVDGLIEERIRTWLGDEHAEFDIAVVVRSSIRIEEHSISASMLAKQNLDDYQRYMDLFNGLGVTRLPYIHVLIERKAASEPLTLRRDIGKRCTAIEMENLLAWERTKATALLTEARLRPSPNMELRVRHKFNKGELVPVEYSFLVEHPFREEEAVPEWVANIAALCIAERSVDQVYDLIREEYPIPRPDFDSTIKRLITMGVLQLASGSRTMSSN
jgi:methylase of polypeptide subunit release factors